MPEQGFLIERNVLYYRRLTDDRNAEEGKVRTDKKVWKKTAGILGLCILLLTGCTASEKNNGQNADGSTGQEAQAQTAEYRQLRVPVPDSFKASTTTGLYLSADYPDDMSNIYIYSTQKDETFSETMQNGQQAFVENLQQAYLQQYEESPEITVLRYEQTQVADQNAYVIELSYTLQGQTYDQLEYIIDAERTYYAAFSQVGEHAWMDAFRECAAGMFFVAQEQ